MITSGEQIERMLQSSLKAQAQRRAAMELKAGARKEVKMYTTRKDDDGDWCIYDPDGEYVCFVICRAAAEHLLSHLNRGQS